MTWIIHVGIGLVGGIIFSVAYPELAQSINDSIYPTISGLIETLKNMAIDSLKRELLG